MSKSKKSTLRLAKKNKDFGQGFYLTDIYEQAFCDPTIKSKRFEGATAEWAEFITKNRYATKNGFIHDYDIVYGPVANDGVYDQLRRFIQGRITSHELAEELKYTNLNNQYYFGSEKALGYLKKI